jgi:hypothetical protein
MKQLFEYFLLLALISGVFSACDKDDEPCDDNTNPECPNYDPCLDVQEPNARFFVEDRLIWPEFGEYLWIHDSILKGGPVRFRSPFEDSQVLHTWYIGSQVFDTPSVIRNFSAVQRPDFITVSHVVTYQVDSLCYPEATGRDSVSQTFYLTDFVSELLTIDNIFRGVHNNTVDSFDFKIRALQSFTGIPAQWNTSGWNIYMINFHNDQDSSRLYSPWSVTNTHFSIYNDDMAGALLVIDPLDLSVEMNYKFIGNDTTFTFKGRVISE